MVLFGFLFFRLNKYYGGSNKQGLQNGSSRFLHYLMPATIHQTIFMLIEKHKLFTQNIKRWEFLIEKHVF